MRQRNLAGILIVSLAAAAGAANRGAPTVILQTGHPASSEKSADQKFGEFVDQFFDGFFHFNPGRATSAGLYAFDSELPAYSRGDFEAEIARSKRALEDLGRIPRPALSRENAFDARLLESSIRGHLLDLENIRLWEKDPNFYNALISEALFVLVHRDFAPVDERLKSLMARERRVPEIFDSARRNLSNPPAVSTAIAINQVKSEIDFLQNDLPRAIVGARDASQLAEFERLNQQTVDAHQKFLSWLQTELAPRSHGEFAIGAENFHKKLLYDDMVSTPLDRLLAMGEETLRKTQADFVATARLIDPANTPAQILEAFSLDHPDAAHVIPEAQSMLEGLRQFIVSHQIVTVLSPQDPRVAETPAFMRALTFASMDTPGAYEEASTEAFFNVTLPERDWSDDQKEQLLRSLNRTALEVTAIHEVYPGHYVQFLWLKRLPTKTRKLAGALHEPWGEVGTNGEGWAHYCEQMMLEQGYGEGDPKLLLFQLHAALLRLCRYIVGIRMHTRGMTLAEGTEFFKKEGYLDQVIAEREAMRGTTDPTYLVYSLGKLEILKLRGDYASKLGDSFQLKEFHDRFLSFGNVPIQMIREEMLGNGSPAL